MEATPIGEMRVRRHTVGCLTAELLAPAHRGTVDRLTTDDHLQALFRSLLRTSDTYYTDIRAPSRLL